MAVTNNDMDKKPNKKWERPTFPKDVNIIAIYEQLKDEAPHWHIYLFNKTERELSTVLVTAGGYGELNGEDVKTTKLRYSLGDIGGYTAKRVEPITLEVMGLYNEYWVSFALDGELYDRKFTFPPSSITSQKSERIDTLEVEAVFAKWTR